MEATDCSCLLLVDRRVDVLQQRRQPHASLLLRVGAVLGVAPLSSTGFVSQVGNAMLALLWLPITIAGYRMARQRRFVEHREWMIRSFALTTSIVVNRLWVVVFIIVLAPQVDTTFGGDQTAMIEAAAGASVWMSWVVNLLVAEWWLQRGRAARRPARLTAPGTAR